MAIDIRERSDFYNVVWIAFPEALGIMVITIQGVVDIFWIGRLGTIEVAAVALCGNIITVLFGLAGFLQIGTIALVSRHLGARDMASASDTLVHSLILGVISGILLLVTIFILSPAIIGFFGVEPEVAGNGVMYLRVLSIYMMFLFFTIPFMASFMSAGDTVTPLVINSVAVICGAILDPIFIFSPGQAVKIGSLVIHPGVFGWGVFGAGVAVTIAVATAVALYLLTIPLGRFPIKAPRLKDFALKSKEFWLIIKIGVPFAVANISRPLSTILLLRIISSFGTGAVAGFGISMRWYNVNWILLGGMGTAAAVLVGQHLGAGSPQRASRVSERLIEAAFVIQFFSTALYWWLAATLIGVMDPNPQTVHAGMSFMRWVVLGFLISSPGGLAMAAMNGAGDTMPGMTAGIVGNWLVKLPLAWVLSRLPMFRLDGVWLAMFISLIVEGAIGLVWYRIGSWTTKLKSNQFHLFN